MAFTFAEPGTAATQDFSIFGAGTVALGTTGTITSASDQVHTGSRSAKISAGATSGGGYIASSNGAVADAGGRVSVWVRWSALVNNTKLVVVQTSVPSNCCQLKINTSGNTLDIDNGSGTTLTTGTVAVTTNTWTRISMAQVITNATTFTIKTWVNGVLSATATNNGTLANTGSSLVAFEQSSSAGAGISTWFSDFYVDNSSALTDTGDIRVTFKRPFSNGTTNGFTTQIGSGGSGYGTGHAPQVNEIPLNAANGWSMVGAGSAVTEEYTVEGASVGDVDISAATLVGIMGWVNAKSVSSETASLIAVGQTGNITLTNASPFGHKFASTSTTYPAGGTDIGIITTNALTTVSLFECGLVIAYNALVAPTFNPLPALGVG